MLDRIKNWYRGVMYGRTGMDNLNRALLVLAAAVLALQLLLSVLFGRSGSVLMSIVLIGLAVFRFLSRNAMRRSAENMMYLQLFGSLKQRFAASRTARKAARSQNPYRTGYEKPGATKKKADRRTKIVACKTCSQKLRVPKGKGKIKVHCPKCGNAFEHKS